MTEPLSKEEIKRRIPRPEEKNLDRGQTVKWERHPQCPKCGDDLQLEGNHVDDYPYIHSDMRLNCLTCGESYLHGIPKRHDIGVAFHAQDTNLLGAITDMIAQGEKQCRYGHGPMLKTKMWGDWIYGEELVEYQWKCPECYLVRQEVHHRRFEHGDNRDTLSKEDKASVIEKLHRLGYI